MDAPLEAYNDRRVARVWIGLNLLPMWLITLALSAGGFLPGSSPFLEMCLPTAALLIMGLIWRGWLAPELLLFDLVPFILILSMDGVPVEYKAPFLLTFAGIMTVGGWIYYRAREHVWRWLVVAAVIALVLLVNANAVRGVWANLGDCFSGCESGIFPGIRANLSSANSGCYPGCVPDAFPGVPWWQLFFRVNG